MPKAAGGTSNIKSNAATRSQTASRQGTATATKGSNPTTKTGAGYRSPGTGGSNPTTKTGAGYKSPAAKTQQTTATRQGISTPTASGSPNNNPVRPASLLQKAIQRNAVRAQQPKQGIPTIAPGSPDAQYLANQYRAKNPETFVTKEFSTDRLPGMTGPTPSTPEFRPGSMAGKFQDRIAPSVNTALQQPAVRSRSPGLGAREAIPTKLVPGRVGPSYGRGGSMGLAPQNYNAPLSDAPTYGPETPTGPADYQRGAGLNLGTTRSIAPKEQGTPYSSIFGGFNRAVDKVKDLGAKVGEGMRKINKIGAGTVLAMTRQRSPQDIAREERRAQEKSSGKRLLVPGYARGGAVEKFMAKYPEFKLT